ncbi:MAG: selenocysteine-specific translation elongation factor, partial [Synergistaceae bacterium]|nr:selenocysteine-specific translation elongation factor [Synergistaceae bacterium]
MKRIVIGTAGHIDHGKTSLIRALTGRDTDRLKEERERGMTIDLGFTWLDLPDGSRAGIIDVPGHEKFIDNMAAGVVGMDLVLMVVAADDGPMPQTLEHLDILSLLGARKGIVVLNKCDLAEPEWLDLVEEDVRERVRGTFLEGAPVVRVSARTGTGLDALVSAIVAATSELEERDSSSWPRLPVDRAFTIKGVGVVVTGTLVSGTLREGDELEIFPTGRRCIVRGIQTHGSAQASCEAGQRTAVDLSGVKKEDLRRGHVLAPPGSVSPTQRMDVRITATRSSRRTLPDRCRLHLLTGTAQTACRMMLLEGTELGPGESALAQLVLEEPLAVKRGDRFVARFWSPLATVAGGEIIEPCARRRRRSGPEALADLRRKEEGTLADVCELHVKACGDAPPSLSDLVRLTSSTREELEEALGELERSGVVSAFGSGKERRWWHAPRERAVRAEILRELAEHRARRPYQDGLPAMSFHRHMKRATPQTFQRYIEAASALGIYDMRGGRLCLPGASVVEDERYRRIEASILADLERAGSDLLRISELTAICGASGDERDMAMDVLRRMIDRGAVVELEDELCAPRALIDEAREKILAWFQTERTLSIAQLRDILGSSRKSAKPLLRYMDTIRVTRREGVVAVRCTNFL